MAEFNPELDATCRENGLVNIADLALSGVIIALKANAYRHKPDRQTTIDALLVHQVRERDRLHEKLCLATSKAFEGGFIKRRLHVGENAFRAVDWFEDIRVGIDKSQYFPGNRVPVVTVDSLNGRSIKTRFELIVEKPSYALTGYIFSPVDYDSDHVRGAAQEIVDIVRAKDLGVAEGSATSSQGY